MLLLEKLIYITALCKKKRKKADFMDREKKQFNTEDAL